MGSLDGGESALRLDGGLFFSSLQDDYCFPVPSHSPETERLECAHAVYTQMIGNLPEEVMEYLDSDDDIGQKCILDIGSGTGRWAWEVAYQYPNVNVTGIDLVHSPIPNLPSNITFIVRDVIYGTGYPDDTFDVVHVQDIGLGGIETRWILGITRGGVLCRLLGDRRITRTSLSGHVAVFQAALHERGLDPFLGSRIQDYVAFVPGLEVGSFSRYCVPLTARHSDPTLSYLGELSTRIWAWFGQSARLLLQDHGPYDSERLAIESINEAEEEELYWFFDTGLIRKI